MNLQQQVQQHLADTGISLRELARRSGISHQAIGNILRGGEYKSGTADKLAAEVDIFHPSNLQEECRQPCGSDAMLNRAELAKALQTGEKRWWPTQNVGGTLDATVEQLAVQCIDADLTHVRDDALECGKQRRIAALEAEVSVWQGQHRAAKVQIDEVKTELECSRIDVRKAETLAKVYSKDLQTMQASWKAACVQAEQLQKQLDQISTEKDFFLVRIERENAETKHDQQIMRLRVYAWILICAIVLLIASGLVVWGGV